MKVINDLLNHIKQHPNFDMLVIKPNLYAYIPKFSINEVKLKGLKITTQDNSLSVYFTRIPPTLSFYKTFLNEYVPVKISYSKLRRIKDQQVKIFPINIPGYQSNEELKENDIKNFCQKTDMFLRYLSNGAEISEIPHAKIQLSNNFLPSWVFKAIET